jgi:hypothetical protein
MPPRKRGNPPSRNKLTEEVMRNIVASVRAGNYLETAASACGVGVSTLRTWLKLGSQKPRSIHARLSDAVTRAQAESISEDLAVIRLAAVNGNWTAAAWRLERKFPDKYGRRERKDLTIEGNVSLTQLITAASEAEESEVEEAHDEVFEGR